MRLNVVDWMWLLFVVVAAIVLCSMGLNSSLWYDEILTLVDFVRLPTAELVTTYTSLNNHILYSLSAKAAIHVFGESAWALRLPAVIFGVASVAALWWLAISVVSRWEARLSALLLAVSYHHIWFSQNARGYTGLLFFSLLATLFFLRGVERRPFGWWLAYAVVFAAAMYIHLSAVLLFAAHALVYLAYRGRISSIAPASDQPDTSVGFWAQRGPILGFVIGGALTAILYSILVPQMIEAFAAVSVPKSTAAVAEWKNPIWTLLEVANNLRHFGGASWIAIPAAGSLAFFGLVHLLKHRPLFALLIIAHPPVTLLALLLLSFRIWPRYFYVDLGFAIILMVHGTFVTTKYATDRLNLDHRWGLSGQRLGVAATALVVIVSLFLLPRNYRYPKQDLRGARDYVESRRSVHDSVATTGLVSSSFEKYVAPHWDTVRTRQELEALRRRRGATWLVYSFPTHTASFHPDIVAFVQADFDHVKTLPGTLGEGAVFIYRSRSASEPILNDRITYYETCLGESLRRASRNFGILVDGLLSTLTAS